MGTEILRPQDCLAPRFRVPPPSFHHRRKNYPTAGNNTYGYRKPVEVRTDQNKRPHQKRFSVDFREHTQNHCDNNFSMQNVSIMRRGQSLDCLNNKDAMYAGSGFSVSPPPSDLPLPTFSKKLSSHDYASRDLRRLLRLE